MRSAILNGIVLIVGGTVALSLGFLVLSRDLIGACSQGWFDANVICAGPRGFSTFAYYFATAGSAFLTLGLWQTGLWKEKIVKDGNGLVISIGLIVLGLGLFASSALPLINAASAEIGFFLGLLGSALLIGGLAKFRDGKAVMVVQSSEKGKTLRKHKSGLSA